MYFLSSHLPAATPSQHLIRFNVIILEDLQLIHNIVGLVAQQLYLLLVGLQHGQGLFDVLQLGVHVGGVYVHNTAKAGKSAGKFSEN